MNESTVMVPEAKLRLVLSAFTDTHRVLGFALNQLPGYADACVACDTLTGLLSQSAAGMPADPVPAPAELAIAYSEWFETLKGAGLGDERAWQVTMERVKVTEAAGAMKAMMCGG